MALSLSTRERRLVALALSYHFGRPGSELDHATRQPLEHGLRELEATLRAHPSPEEQSRSFELTAWQFERLQSAMKGCITELRVHHLRQGAASTVEGWSAAAHDLFPELREDPEAGLDLAEEMMMLSRRLARAS